MRSRPITLIAAFAFAFAFAGTAHNVHAAPSVGLYVVPGIFFDDAARGASQSSGTSSKIDPGFRSSLDLKETVALLQQRAQAHFPTLEATIDSKNRLRTLALSVQVTRVSRYQIDKTDGT